MQIVEVAFSGTVGTRDMGPVSTVILELSNRFADRGHEVILTDVAGDAPRNLLHHGIRLLELPGGPENRFGGRARTGLRSLARRWSNYHGYMRELASRMDLAKADVVHLHSPAPAFLARRLYGVNVFYTAHTPLWSLEQTAASTTTNVEPRTRVSIMGRLNLWVEREVIRRSSLTVGFGDYLAAAVPGAPVVTIPNGIDTAAWVPVDKPAARAALGIGERDFVVLFTGRINHVKGVDVLLDAVRLLAPSVPNLKVLVVGPLSGSFDTRDEHVDPYAREMMEASRGLPVRFLGFINNRDAEYRRHLAAADVFVLPSRAEPQGLVVLESLAMGIPVIGSATGGIPDMVSADVGYLFPPGDAVSLAARIRETHDDPRQLERMRKAARARAESQFSWNSAADRYLAEFEAVARSRAVGLKTNQAVAPDEITR